MLNTAETCFGEEENGKKKKKKKGRRVKMLSWHVNLFTRKNIVEGEK